MQLSPDARELAGGGLRFTNNGTVRWPQNSPVSSGASTVVAIAELAIRSALRERTNERS